jgi:phenylalanyl-tRNA synthetase beta chain
MTETEFRDLCFSFGVELDEVTSDLAVQAASAGISEAEAARRFPEASSEIVYKIDLPANRTDLLCFNGLVAAFRTFLGSFNDRVQPPAPDAWPVRGPVGELRVDASVSEVRPIVKAALLSDIQFTPASYKSFIDLQEKLHANICRRRSLASIGTHDADAIRWPLTYTAREPDAFSFVHLNSATPSVARTGRGVFEVLRNDLHLRKFLPLIEDSPVWPVVEDASGKVLSLPPIINSEWSKITLSTRNVLIEVTGTDATKVEVALNTVVTAFAVDAGLRIGAVTIVNARGESELTPNLQSRPMSLDLGFVRSMLGLSPTDLTAAKASAFLSRMGFASSESSDGTALVVQVPPTRTDVLHPVDVVADVAVAYGYGNLPVRVPAFHAVAALRPITSWTEAVRFNCAYAGFLEVLTLSLCSREEQFANLRLEDPGDDDAERSPVSLANPASAEYQICRMSLLVGLFKTLRSNKDAPKPIRLFEVSDVVLRSHLPLANDVGARNERHVAAVYTGANSTGTEHMHGLCDYLMEKLEVLTPAEKERRVAEEAAKAAARGRSPDPITNSTYTIRSATAAETATGPFFPNMTGIIELWQHGAKTPLEVGRLGVIHPEVLRAFGIDCPTSGMEFNLEAITGCH